MSTLDLDALRELLATIYTRLRRNKMLRPLPGGLFLLVLDGHEGRHSRRRQWEGCLTRTVETPAGSWQEFFPRYVAAQLVGDGFTLVLDIESQRPGEGELTAAERLLERLLKRLPRAFDVVMGDALYASGSFWQIARQAGKYVLTVLKQEDRDLLKDARALWKQHPEPVATTSSSTESARYWDLSDMRTWPQAGESVRLVRAEFERRVVRQLNDQEEVTMSEWVWVTTLPSAWSSAPEVARLGRLRWKIENNAFNDLVTEWHADHLYRCSTRAIEAFVLLTCVAQAVFHAFWRGNLKPALKVRLTARGLGDIVRGELRAMALPTCDSS